MVLVDHRAEMGRIEARKGIPSVRTVDSLGRLTHSVIEFVIEKGLSPGIVWR